MHVLVQLTAKMKMRDSGIITRITMLLYHCQASSFGMAICMYNIIYVCYISCKNYKINVVLCMRVLVCTVMTGAPIAGMGGDCMGLQTGATCCNWIVKTESLPSSVLCGVVLHF